MLFRITLVRCLVALCALAAGAVAPIHAQSLAPVAAELGVTPESLVIAGFTTTEAETMLGRLSAAEGNRQTLSEAHTDLSAALAEVARWRVSLLRRPESDAVRAGYQQALANLETARQAVAAARDTLLWVMTDGFATAQVDALINVHAGAGHRVPAAFRANVRTAADWFTLERALRAEARAQRRSETLSDEHTRTLAAVRAEPKVVLAAARLDTHLNAMRQVFRSE